MAIEIIRNILIVGGIGSLIFTVFIAIIAYTGLAEETRDKEGKFKKKLTWKSVMAFILFVSFLLGLLYAGNTRLINSFEENPGLLLLWINSFGIFFVVNLFDLIVLDYLIIVKWHPKFLKLPDTEYYRTVEPHMKGFIKGISIGMVFSFIVSLVGHLSN